KRRRLPVGAFSTDRSLAAGVITPFPAGGQPFALWGHGRGRLNIARLPPAPFAGRDDCSDRVRHSALILVAPLHKVEVIPMLPRAFLVSILFALPSHKA